MNIDEPTQADEYQLELWAEQRQLWAEQRELWAERRQLWQGSFIPSNNGKAWLGAPLQEVGYILTAGQLLLCHMP